LLLTTAVLAVGLFVGRAPAEEKAKSGEGNQGKDAQAREFHLNGKWTVLYAAMDGKRLDDKSISDVTIRDGMLTCKCNGKEQTWRFNMQPSHMVWAFETDGKAATEKGAAEARPFNASKARVGVYVAAPDFLCLGLDKVGSARGGAPGVPGAPPVPPRPGAGAAPGAVPPAAAPPGAAPQPAPGGQALPGTTGTVPGLQAQAQQIQTSDFVLVLKRSGREGEKGR
jgi:hypothetical protein